MAAARALFLCTGNSARSILAEAIATDCHHHFHHQNRFYAYSAGSHPTGEVHPEAMALLKSKGHDISRLRSKSWDEFTGSGAPVLSWVITLCDSAAAEGCPTFRTAAGQPLQRLHWGLADPATGAASFEATYQALSERIQRLLTTL